MIDFRLLMAVITGAAVLLFLILKLRLHAFISLLIASILIGILADQEATATKINNPGPWL